MDSLSSLPFCSIVYGLWSAYFRCEDVSFMGLNRQTGWRGGRRFLREFGHGAYLVWNIGQVRYRLVLEYIEKEVRHI